MRRHLRPVLLVGLLLLLAAAAAVVLLYRTSRQVPEFYRLALEVDPATQRTASDKMVQQTAALIGDVQKQGPWQAVFSEEEINGWLAVERVKTYADLIPDTVTDPRVRIEPESLTLAFGYRDATRQGVVSLALDLYLVEPNVVALRVRKARVGALPLPLESILKEVAKATDQLDWQVDWRQAGGDPVAQITIPPLKSHGGRVVQIETLRLEKGRILVAGTTRRR